MALNTGGFTLGVMPTAPTGVEKLGAFNVGQVLEASRLGADNVEAAFNTPFRVQQEIAKTKATQAASKIAQAKAARAAEAVDADLAGVKASVKAQELANRLKQETFDANANLEKIRTEQAATNLAASKEENPLKQKVLQSQAEQLGVAAEAAQLDLEAAKQAGVFAEQAKSKASAAKLLAGESELGLETIPIRQKALHEFGDTGTREVAPGVIQTLVPTASVSTITTPSAKLLAAKPQTVPVYMGTDDKGNAIVQNYTVDPTTGDPRSAIGAKLTVRDLPAGVVGAEGYKAPTKVSVLQKALDTRLVKSLETLPDDIAKYESAKSQITKAKDLIRESWGATSGVVAGFIPDMVVRSRKDAMNAAQTAVQNQLRAIYGAQFTEKEGERFFNTVFDRHAKEEENIDRLDRLQQSLDRAINAKIAMSDWLESGKDTFKGFHGKLLPALTAEQAAEFTSEQVAESLGSLTTPAQGEPATPSSGGVPTITSKDEWDKLPAGARFVWNGQTLIK